MGMGSDHNHDQSQDETKRELYLKFVHTVPCVDGGNKYQTLHETAGLFSSRQNKCAQGGQRKPFMVTKNNGTDRPTHAAKKHRKNHAWSATVSWREGEG